MTKDQKFQFMCNAFMAQAVADAVGRPFEFGCATPGQVLNYAEKPGTLRITDDTQMALFGLEGLLWSEDDESIKRNVQRAYLRWYLTQSQPLEWNLSQGLGGLIREADMRYREAPGNACMTNLRYLHVKGQRAPNKSRGCGAVMRLLPFSFLYLDFNDDFVQSIAQDSASSTHQHIDIPAAVDLYMRFAKFQMGGEVEYPHLRMFKYIASAPNIQAHGEGWISSEAVPMAIWAVCNSESYEELLIKTICHKGDSDSVAAIAGGLWGLSGRSGWEAYAPRLLQGSIIQGLVKSYASKDWAA